MLVKIYWSLWAVFVAATVILFAAGDFTSLVAVVLGLVAFGLTFMGIMGVLPTLVTQHGSKEPAKVKVNPVTVEPRQQVRTAEAFGKLKSA